MTDKAFKMNKITKSLRKVRKLIDRAYMLLIIVRLMLFFKNKPRFSLSHVKVLGYNIFLNDPRSFYFEFIHIFKNEIYGFHSEKESPLIIDGGGFIGASCLYFKRKYPKAKIIVFEPDSNALSILRKNIEINKLDNITVVEMGLYDKDTEISFLPNDTDGGKIDTDGIYKIKVTKLNNYINSEIDFLKLNIEGSELNVFEDLDKNDKFKYIRELCIEYHSFKRQKQNLDRILGILTKNNFRYYIGNFENSPKGNFKSDENAQFYLLVYAKNSAI